MTRRPEALGWKVSAVLRTQDRLHEIETWSQNGAARQLRIDGKAATQVMLGRIARVLWLIPAMDRLWIEGAEGRRRFLDRMTLSFDPNHGEQVLTYEKAMRERNRLLKNQVTDAHWYRAIEGQMATTGVQIRKARAGGLGLYPCGARSGRNVLSNRAFDADQS
jgi:DNA replication and repair protein RecF